MWATGSYTKTDASALRRSRLQPPTTKAFPLAAAIPAWSSPSGKGATVFQQSRQTIVAVNVANTNGAPVSLSTARTSTFCGPSAPSVQRSCATPRWSVISVPPKTLPPPATTRKFRTWPRTGPPPGVVTFTTSGLGSSSPAPPDCPSPETNWSERSPGAGGLTGRSQLMNDSAASASARHLQPLVIATPETALNGRLRSVCQRGKEYAFDR